MQTLIYRIVNEVCCFVSLMRNPVANKQSYRFYVIHKLPQVRVLDFVRIKKKVATFIFNMLVL